jgi:hypothetical protein
MGSEPEVFNAEDKSAGSERKPRSQKWEVNPLIAPMLGLFGLLLLAVSQNKYFSSQAWSSTVAQIGLGLLITSISFFLMDRELDKSQKRHAEAIIKEQGQYLGARLETVEEHLSKTLIDVNESLEVVQGKLQMLDGAFARGVDRIYARREEGQIDIMKDMSDAKMIWILGISLHDFFASSGRHYREMGTLIEKIEHSDDRAMRVLLINPFSEQATIRAERESDQDFSDQKPYEKSSLFSDVQHSIQYLSDRIREDAALGILKKELADGPLKEADSEDRLKKLIDMPEEEFSKQVGPENNASNEVHRHIQARVYNAAPACFLVITDSHTYIEQYHYGLHKSGLAGGNFPLMRFKTVIPGSSISVAGSSITAVAAQLYGHFEYIWRQLGTVPLTHLTQGHNIGVSKSAWECGLANLFSSRSWAEERIKYILLHETKEIKLIGISLRDFFHAGKGLYTAIVEASNRVSVRALVLDPYSDQGRYRSEREEPGVITSGGNLFSEVKTSIRTVERLQKQGTQGLKVDARLYFASPSCFAILTSESLIVEQYHYGRSELGANILGGKVAVLEYCKDKESGMYEEINGHFDHIWKDLSIGITEWKAKHPDALNQAANVVQGDAKSVEL